QEPFQGADLLAVSPGGQVQAGVEALAVDDDVARAALAHLAALFHRREAEVVAEHIGKAGADVHHRGHGLAIDGAMDFFKLCHQRSPPARWMDSVRQRLASSTAMCSRKALDARQESRGWMSWSTALLKAATSPALMGCPFTRASALRARMGTGPATP